MSFQIHALPVEPFAPLFALSDQELIAHHAQRITVKASDRAPCRVSLAAAEDGESVLLVNFLHQPGASPYRSRHAIYVRERAVQRQLDQGEVPDILRPSVLALRLFDADHCIVDADLVDGEQLETALEAGLADPQVAYAHLHFAKRGCFAASATRA